MPQERYTYKAYGKLISCNFPIQGWCVDETTINPKPDLEINLGNYRSNQQEELVLIYSSIHYRKSNQPLFKFYKSSGDYIFSYPGVADYCLSTSSDRIGINSHYKADHGEVLYFLVKGPVLTLWLTLNRMICLHASSVIIKDHAVGFLAPSLTGKSTLALCFLEKGYKLVSDDILAINSKPSSSGYVVQPSMPLIKTRISNNSDVVDANPRLSIKSPGKNDKVVNVLDLFPSSWQSTSVPLAKIYCLERVDDPGIEISSLHLQPSVRLFSLIANQQAGLVFEKLDLYENTLEYLADLANMVTIVKLRYPSGLNEIGKVVDFVIRDVG